MFETENPTNLPQEEALSVEEIEAALADVSDDLDAVVPSDYDKCLVLNKKEVANFIRIVEPLTKACIDTYGRSIFIHCEGPDAVTLNFNNVPYLIKAKVSNHSGKMVRDFAVDVVTLRKLICSIPTSLIIVEQDNDLYLSFAGQLMIIESQSLMASQYDVDQKMATDTIDKEIAIQAFKNVSGILANSDRAFEKIAVLKKGQLYYNTGCFAACLASPFSGDVDMLVYKQVADAITTLCDISKDEVMYGIYDKTLVVSSGSYYAEFPTQTGDKVNEFVSTSSNIALQFDANIEVVNDALEQLITIVRSLDYLSKNLTLRVSNLSMDFEVQLSNFSKSFTYSFPIASGRPDANGEMHLKADVLALFMKIVGKDIKYSFTQQGLGIENVYGRYLLKMA